LSEEEIITQLFDYIGKIPYLKPSDSKEKEKDTREIILLVLLTETAGLVSPILPAYMQQIILLEFNTTTQNSIFEN